MICVCDNCLSVFKVMEGKTDCAYCKSHNIRQATEKEELEYYRKHSDLAVEIQRYVLVETIHGPMGWYVDLDDKVTEGSSVIVDYGTHFDTTGIVRQVLRADTKFPPYKKRIKPILEVIELI
ncbi:MAG: hypothetical protein IJQ07_02765 [Clostridia bacterium]|nr:hypothetical protein [Clostridia bacterium]MBR0189745.1 hypothetical protein [Clostridia bacterium]